MDENQKKPTLQFGLRTLLLLVLVVAVGLVVFDRQRRSTSASGRYLLHSTAPDRELGQSLYMIDTQTGRSWHRGQDGKWYEEPTPADLSR